MEQRIIDVPGVFDARPLGYVQCVAAGNLVFISGQGGLDERLQLVSPEFAPQARQALHNVRRALEAAGVAPADVTALTVYLTDIGDLRAFGAVKREELGELAATSTTVAVSALALPGMRVEVAAIAVRPDRPPAVNVR